MKKLGFEDGEDKIDVVARMPYDLICQSGDITSAKLAQSICAKVLENTANPAPSAEEDSAFKL